MAITFVIRIKSNRKCTVYLNNEVKKRPVKLKAVHRYLTKKGKNSCEIVIYGDYIAKLLIVENTALAPDEPFLYLLTNVADEAQAKQVYHMRWKIECCFKHLKSNGFELEKQVFTAPHKVEMLMSILVLIYAIAIYEGILIHQCPENKPKSKNRKSSINSKIQL